jgi:multidrug efflux pump subunit AcrA (membrane-fusion protein)
VVKTVEFNGRVAPVIEQELFFQTSGFVRNVFVKRDEFVTKGQVLADLEIDSLERELASAQLELERVQQQLEKAEQEHADTLVRARLNLEMAQAKLTKEEQDWLNDLAEARINLVTKKIELAKAQNYDPNSRETVAAADFLKARIAVQQAQLAYDEIAYADDLGSSSQAVELQEATLNFERAQAAYDLALEEIENYSHDLELLNQQVALAELEVKRLQETGTSAQLELEVALAQLEVDILERGIDPTYKNNVKRAQLDVQKLEATIAEAQIIAPLDGQILSKSLSEGREVTAFKPVMIIADLTELEISANPFSSELSGLAENMPVKATITNRPGEEIAGFIRRLPYPYGGGGRSEGVEEEDESTRITLERLLEELGLEVGDLMRIEVILESKDDVLWLPPQAIRTFEGRKFVVVQDGEVQRRIDVKIGITSEDRVEIVEDADSKEGLTEGQIVIGP